MTAEEYLNKLVDIDKRISAIRRAIEKCYARAESTSPQSSDVIQCIVYHGQYA